MLSKKNSLVGKLVLLFLLYVLVIGTTFTLLWNWLVPTIFGLQTIHLGQSLGLLILGRLFFGISTRASFGKLKKFSKSSDSLDDNESEAQREKWRNEWRKICNKDDTDKTA